MNTQSDTERERLSKGIRRQIGGDLNKRFLRNLPQFRASDVLPEPMLALLQQLDAREAGGKSRRPC